MLSNTRYTLQESIRIRDDFNLPKGMIYIRIIAIYITHTELIILQNAKDTTNQ